MIQKATALATVGTVGAITTTMRQHIACRTVTTTIQRTATKIWASVRTLILVEIMYFTEYIQ